MKIYQKLAGLILISILSVVTQVQAQMVHKSNKDHVMIKPGDIQWVDGPPSLPPGSKIAVIEGDPKAEGLFTMRIKIPANYKIMPHWHPANEHVTVVEGSFHMGLGEKYDEKAATEIPIGGFAIMNKGTRHYAFTTKESIVQLHGMGPWGINYVNPADDPRNKKVSSK